MKSNHDADFAHFQLECPNGQNILLPLPEPSFADVRFFMRGPVLDGTDGRASLIQKSICDKLLATGCNGAVSPDFGTRPLIAPKQVHGVHVLVVAPSGFNLNSENGTLLEADGVLLMSRDFDASLRFGDCAPILVLPSEKWAREYRPWALLLHSGYKGTVQNIVASGLNTLKRVVQEQFGQDAALDAVRDSHAWVFPCIAGDDYPRTLEDWTKRGLEAFRPENVRHDGEHYYFNIAGELRLQLLDCGLAKENIHLSPWTTVGNPELCYSYRCGDDDRMFLYATLSD